MTILCFLLVVGLAACDQAGAEPTQTPTPTEAVPTATPEPEAMTLVDDLGTDVEVTQPVERIITLAPSNTEIAFALGLGERIVGVSDWSDHPPEALDIQKVGTGTEGNLELIVSLDPDLVLAIGGEPVPAINAQLRDLGIAVLVLAADDLEGIYHDIELVGKAAGAEEAAEAVVAREIRYLDQLQPRNAPEDIPGLFIYTAQAAESAGVVVDDFFVQRLARSEFFLVDELGEELGGVEILEIRAQLSILSFKGGVTVR